MSPTQNRERRQNFDAPDCPESTAPTLRRGRPLDADASGRSRRTPTGSKRSGAAAELQATRQNAGVAQSLTAAQVRNGDGGTAILSQTSSPKTTVGTRTEAADAAGAAQNRAFSENLTQASQPDSIRRRQRVCRNGEDATAFLARRAVGDERSRSLTAERAKPSLQGRETPARRR